MRRRTTGPLGQAVRREVAADPFRGRLPGELLGEASRVIPPLDRAVNESDGLDVGHHRDPQLLERVAVSKDAPRLRLRGSIGGDENGVVLPGVEHHQNVVGLVGGVDAAREQELAKPLDELNSEGVMARVSAMR